MTSTNIHDCKTILPDVHINSEGERGWISFKILRENWFNNEAMEEVQVAMFTEDVAMLAKDLSEALREGIAQMDETIKRREEK